MPIMALIAASALAAAEWRSPPVSNDDYPGSALLKDKSAASVLDILIDPNGKVVKCTQSGVVGDQELASQMCVIAKRKSATPARDANGKPAFGFRRDFASLMLPGTYQADQIGDIRRTPDIDLEVASVPAGSPSPLLISVNVAVDKAGMVTGCDYTGDSAAAFGKVACMQAQGMTFDKLTDAGGKPINYVRPVSVRFSLATKAG